MNSRKTTSIVLIGLLVVALVLGLRMVSRSAPDRQAAVAADKTTTGTRQKPGPQVAEKPSAPPKAGEPVPAVETSRTKIAERRESPVIRDLERYGIFVEAEQVGNNSASGKVRVTMPGGAILEADRVKMSSGGMLVAEGNPVMVKGEARAEVGGENGAMAIYYDEERQGVVMRAGDADKVTSDDFSNDDHVTDPDRGNLAPAEPEE